MVALVNPPRHDLTLPDGRRLSYHEYGARGGRPCFYEPGTPASGLAGAAYHDAAGAGGVRWIAIDRPGYGGSDFSRHHSLVGHAWDLAAVADHLGLSRFAVAGESGGGPYALAAAHELPERLTGAVVMAGMGPACEPWVSAGMKPANRRLISVARRAPFALRLPMALTRRTLQTQAGVDRLTARQLTDSPPSDRRVMSEMAAFLDVSAAASDALRQGSRAAAHELALFARPWGFTVTDIACPVVLWHGEDDVNVPVDVGRRMAMLIPEASAHVLPNEGHSVGWSRRTDVMAAVVRARS